MNQESALGIGVRGRNYTQARGSPGIRRHQSTPGHPSGVQASFSGETGKDAVADGIGGGLDSVRLLSNLVQQKSQIVDLFEQLLGLFSCAVIGDRKFKKTALRVPVGACSSCRHDSRILQRMRYTNKLTSIAE